jgi:uncharacterized membrane protein (DUF2068 family)
MQNLTIDSSPKLPLGITILAVLLVIAGILELYVSWAGLLGATNLFVAVVAAIVGLASLFVAWGLWKLKKWAFWTIVVIEALAIAAHLTRLFAQPYVNFGAKIVGVIFAGLILIYLFADPNVRRAFRLVHA